MTRRVAVSAGFLVWLPVWFVGLLPVLRRLTHGRQTLRRLRANQCQAAEKEKDGRIIKQTTERQEAEQKTAPQRQADEEAERRRLRAEERERIARRRLDDSQSPNEKQETQRQQQSQQEGERRRVSEQEAQGQRVAEQEAERREAPPSIIPEKEMLEFLLGLSGYQAWCCGFANRMADGAVVRDTSHFHLDHLDPKSKGGSNQITNRAPLCAKHNLRKSDRRVHLADYRREIASAGELKVSNISDLVDLTWAYQKALDYYAKAQAGQEPAEASDGARQSSRSRPSLRGRPSASKRRGTRW